MTEGDNCHIWQVGAYGAMALSTYGAVEAKLPDGDNATHGNLRSSRAEQAWATLEVKRRDVKQARKLFQAAIAADKQHAASWHGWGLLEKAEVGCLTVAQASSTSVPGRHLAECWYNAYCSREISRNASWTLATRRTPLTCQAPGAHVCRDLPGAVLGLMTGSCAG